MKKIITWVKQNKLTAVLLVIIAVLVYSRFNRPGLPRFANKQLPRSGGGSAVGGPELMAPSLNLNEAKTETAAMPQPARSDSAAGEQETVPSQNRMVIQNTSLSMKVEEVEPSINQLKSLAEQHGGFMVNSHLTKPEGAASGTIRVRVASDQLDSFLQAAKNLSVKVVSEYVSGRDITEQYQDIEERLRILNQTKSKFEAILQRAEDVDDMLKVQRELLRVQDQIDNLKGRKDALEKKVNLSLVTIYVSTDELALPYAPDQAWRPKLVFKQAVRSLISTSRSLGSLIIWLAVYAPYWLAGIAIYLIIKKLKKNQ